MIVMASDEVGYQVVKFLLDLDETIDFLVLDSRDRGGFNAAIETAWRERTSTGLLLASSELAEPDILARITAVRHRIGILAWWPYILKGPLLTVPEIGWLNFHPGYLPYNRGKHPNFWCLVDGTPCGVSLHFIDEGVDTGDVIVQEEIPVSWEDTGETIHRRCREKIVELFKSRYDEIINGRLQRIRQDPSSGTFHLAKEIDEVSRINLDESYSARRLLNILRARTFPPHPPATFTENGKKYGVRIHIEELSD